MRSWYRFPLPDSLAARLAVLAGAEQQACVLGGEIRPGFSEPLLAGIGALETITAQPESDSFAALQAFADEHHDWLFGHFSYDLKNETEPQLHSAHPDGIGFPLLHFFRPRLVLRETTDQQLEIGCLTGAAEAEACYARLCQPLPELLPQAVIHAVARTSHEDYLKAIQHLHRHIARGDIYETNYCMEYFASDAQLHPVDLQRRLLTLNPAPFSAFYKLEHRYVCCASPERFLLKKGRLLRSQPIKGTRPRGTTPEEDERLRHELQNDPKERCENVMIVDLVRNDLSRSAARGTVRVPELFGVYSFRSVHQLISTVEAELAEDVHPVEAIRRAFPMGSMTGAPKVRAMELCEATEQMRRGLYSGAIGYFTPEQDFDFNVVIRSVQYNAQTRYLSLMAGSAITAAADAEAEYAECRLKAASLLRALGVPEKSV